jgi:hypothetical protein
VFPPFHIHPAVFEFLKLNLYGFLNTEDVNPLYDISRVIFNFPVVKSKKIKAISFFFSLWWLPLLLSLEISSRVLGEFSLLLYSSVAFNLNFNPSGLDVDVRH